MNININKHITTIAAIISLFVFTSCEKEIDVDLKSAEPKLVIEGLVTADSLAKVKLTMSKNFISDNTFDPVLGALVSVSDNTGNSEILQMSDDGMYRSKNLKGVPGRTYNLKVTVEGQEYTASSAMSPHTVKIDSITMYPIPLFKYAFPMIHFQDPKGSKNYYRELLYINGKRKKLDEDATDTDDREGFYMSRIVPAYKENGSTEDPIKKGDTITIEHQLLDKGAYTFFETLGRISSSLTNPTSNIKGGALGYFSAYTYDRQTIIADWTE
ncbi:uncharacterized protein DUF4249 [Dysgonomonas alginatilytica]|uniref:Uncharacterized protein DUF4249 n=1 Tax=Dysgonomonas alginatilytica TaxID=1605892 RepID=A0A2V3PT35_9BACT|nr:DUF4249 domain-containing protein [Dysgonomonas alginatilytica]PXV68773.1 uncharacterized protein DUF4249 [Dysgonomonas alginatilytica]